MLYMINNGKGDKKNRGEEHKETEENIGEESLELKNVQFVKKKQLDDFHKNKRFVNTDGHSYICKDCAKKLISENTLCECGLEVCKTYVQDHKTRSNHIERIKAQLTSGSSATEQN